MTTISKAVTNLTDDFKVEFEGYLDSLLFAKLANDNIDIEKILQTVLSETLSEQSFFNEIKILNNN